MGDTITTIEELAAMIQRTMASKEDVKELEHNMDKRFKNVDTRLDGIDTRLDGIDTRLDNMDVRFDNMDARLDNMDARMGRIEGDIYNLPEEIVYRQEFEDVSDRIKYVEKKLHIESGV